MPFLVQTVVNGIPTHAIEQDKPRRPRERLGRETARLAISATEAARGIDALVAENFPEAVAPKEHAYHGA